MKECREFLIDKGYDTSIEGGNYFIDLLEEVVCYLDQGNSDDEIRGMLPSLFLEYYHFYYEVSRFKYLGSLDFFCQNGNKNVPITINQLSDNLLILGKRYLEEKRNNDDKKQFTKKKRKEEIF